MSHKLFPCSDKQQEGGSRWQPPEALPHWVKSELLLGCSPREQESIGYLQPKHHSTGLGSIRKLCHHVPSMGGGTQSHPTLRAAGSSASRTRKGRACDSRSFLTENPTQQLEADGDLPAVSEELVMRWGRRSDSRRAEVRQPKPYSLCGNRGAWRATAGEDFSPHSPTSPARDKGCSGKR